MREPPPEALSAAQTQVLALAARGMTNGEMAVPVHQRGPVRPLTRACAKLGVSGYGCGDQGDRDRGVAGGGPLGGRSGHPAVVGLEALVAAVHQRRGDQEVGGGAVAGHRDVPHHGDAQQRLDVRVVRLRLERVPEEDQDVDLALRDLGADLLVAAERAALQAGDRQPELVAEQRAGGAGGAEVVLGQQRAVEPGPLREVRLLVVVRDQGDPAARAGSRSW